MEIRPLLVLLTAVACGTASPDPRPSEEPARSRALAPPALSEEASPPPRAEPPPAAEPPAPPEPTYDLAADLERRRELARGFFGDDVRIEVVEEVFLVVGAPPMSRSMFRRALSLIRRSTAAYFNNRFGRRPGRAVSVYLFDGLGPYRKFCRAEYDGCGTPYGVYYHADRRIVMNGKPGLGTLTHELVHPIVETDFPAAPDWINEGIASLFEAPSIPRAGEIHGRTNWRLPRLRRELRTRAGRARATLPRLFASARTGFRGADEDLMYAMARYLCQWLDERDLLWSFYQAWRDDVANDPTGEKAFTRVTGVKPADANAAWVRWLKKL